MAGSLKLLHQLCLEVSLQLALKLVADVLGTRLKILSESLQLENCADVLEDSYLGACHWLDDSIAVAELKEEYELWSSGDSRETNDLSWLRIEDPPQELWAHLPKVRCQHVLHLVRKHPVVLTVAPDLTLKQAEEHKSLIRVYGCLQSSRADRVQLKFNVCMFSRVNETSILCKQRRRLYLQSTKLSLQLLSCKVHQMHIVEEVSIEATKHDYRAGNEDC